MIIFVDFFTRFINKFHLSFIFIYQVRGKTTRGWGEYSTTLYSSTAPVSPPDGASNPSSGDFSNNDNHGVTRVNNKDNDTPVGIIAGAIVAVFVCLAIVVIIIIVVFRRSVSYITFHVNHVMFGHFR